MGKKIHPCTHILCGGLRTAFSTLVAPLHRVLEFSSLRARIFFRRSLSLIAVVLKRQKNVGAYHGTNGSLFDFSIWQLWVNTTGKHYTRRQVTVGSLWGLFENPDRNNLRDQSRDNQ